jgi:hypothetical protein
LFIIKIRRCVKAMNLTQIDDKYFSTATPVHAAKGTGSLTFTGGVSDGEVVVVDSETYEFDTNGSVVGTNIAVDVSGGATAGAAIVALLAEITAHSALVDAIDDNGDVLTATSKLTGDVGNYDVSTTCASASWGAGITSLSGGQFATVASFPSFWIQPVTGAWWVCEAPVDKYATSGWLSFTPATVVA